MTKKTHVASPFDHLDCTNGMLPLMTLLASCVTAPASMASHNQKCSVAHCFNCLDLMNTVILLIMPLASYAADASANSVKQLKSPIEFRFDHLY